MAKLNNDWSNAFGDTFETEEDVIEFIFERFDTSDFEDSYNYMNWNCEPNESFKFTAEDKRRNFYDFMMELAENNNGGN
jgi:hypothetical protein